jgi:hypothetical protein
MIHTLINGVLNGYRWYRLLVDDLFAKMHAQSD